MESQNSAVKKEKLYSLVSNDDEGHARLDNSRKTDFGKDKVAVPQSGLHQGKSKCVIQLIPLSVKLGGHINLCYYG